MADRPDHGGASRASERSAATFKAFRQGVADRNEQASKDAKKRRTAFSNMRESLRAKAEGEGDKPPKPGGRRS